MLQIDYVALQATSLICDNGGGRGRKHTIAFDSWKYKHFNFIWAKFKNISGTLHVMCRRCDVLNCYFIFFEVIRLLFEK